MHSSIASASMPARAIASRAAMGRVRARKPARLPWKRAIGVRQALAMTTSFTASEGLGPWDRGPWRSGEAARAREDPGAPCAPPILGRRRGPHIPQSGRSGSTMRHLHTQRTLCRSHADGPPIAGSAPAAAPGGFSRLAAPPRVLVTELNRAPGSSAGGAEDPREPSRPEDLLLAGLRTRDERAVEEFPARYKSLLHHCIGQFTHDATEREDLYQDLVIHALDRLDGTPSTPRRAASAPGCTASPGAGAWTCAVARGPGAAPSSPQWARTCPSRRTRPSPSNWPGSRS